jgi:hypothetical protein
VARRSTKSFAEKYFLFNAILAKRKLFLIIHETSVPAPTTFNGSLMPQPQQIPYDARPSLIAAAFRGSDA